MASTTKHAEALACLPPELHREMEQLAEEYRRFTIEHTGWRGGMPPLCAAELILNGWRKVAAPIEAPEGSALSGKIERAQ